ncbi:MAG: cation:proton antiporter [Petrimonas sp.]|nr:cation:proton antiporter [Petrimonas sp.]
MEGILSRLSHEFALPFTDPVLIFGLLLLIILAVPLVSDRMNVPSIVGLIIAGIFLGPYGIGLIENSGAIEMFSTIGLLYIMFTVGLELDIHEFKANKRKSLLFGFFTFSIPLVLGLITCQLILKMDWVASLLVSSMFATHTLVSYPIISKLGVTKNQAVAVTVGGTVIADTVALVILAVIIQGKEGSLDFGFFARLIISLLVFSVIVFVFIPKIARKFFEKVGSEKYAHYIFVLFVVFLAGLLAEIEGVEPIIGAFLAGLALNPLIPQTSALMNRIEFIGNALFIPIFLISVGMMLDIGVTLHGTTTLYIAVVITIVAVVGKWAAAHVSGFLFKYGAAQRNLIFGLSTSRAAATLAMALVGYRANILSEHLMNATILLILITCIISSFVTEKSAKRIAINEEIEPLTPSSMGSFAHEKILVPIANPSNIGHHVQLALLLKDKKSVNPVSLLGVFPNNDEVEKNIVNFHKKLKEFVSSAIAAEVEVDVLTTIDHNVPSGIVRMARETMSDIVILGWPGRVGMLEKLLGDKVDLIIKNMDKNLAICHIENTLINHKRIVVISPPLAEKEAGFAIWVDKVVKLAQELSIRILHLGHPATQEVIASQKKIASIFTFKPFTDWSDPLSCSNQIRKDDMIILISAHAGYISHISILDNLPTRLEDRFPDYSRIVVYPKQHTADNLLETSDSIFTP